ncbi:MAG: DMT family transporter [Promethearchaeota archaeon]
MNPNSFNFKVIFVYVLLILMITFWGISFIIVHIAVEYIPPLSVALYRLFVASLSFLILDIYLKLRKKCKIPQIQVQEIDSMPSLNFWILIVLASFSGISLYLFFLYSAVELIGPSIPALYDCLVSPVIIAVFSLIFFQEKLNKLKIVGFLLASVGSYFLITGGDISKFTPASPSFIGYVFILLTPILWATYSTIIKHLEKFHDIQSDFKILKYICYLGCLELFIFVVISNQLYIFLINFLNIILLLCGIYLGLICFVFGYYTWNYSQKKLQSSKVASFLYIEPFITLIFSFLFQRTETILLLNIIGAIIVLIGVVIINYK